MMKPFDCETNFPDACADQLLATLPLVMRVFREEMDSRMPEGLTVPQFISMGFLHRNEGASISELADHLRLTLPTVSKIVDGLVEREIVTRVTSTDDRRRAILTLTDKGRSVFDTARKAASVRIEKMLESISTSEEETISAAMRILRRVFLPQSGCDQNNNQTPTRR